MTTAYLIAVHVLAFVGLLSILASVGVWLFTSRLPVASLDPEPVPASEVVGRFTNGVRVVPHRAVVGTFAHGSPAVVKCIHCGEPATHSCDLDDFIAHNATPTDRDAS